MKELEEINKIIEVHQHLAKQAYLEYLPIVNELIDSKNTDGNKIGFILDSMLEFCNNKHMLNLYKKLCRYYWDIDQHATATYILYYRERWDEDSLMGVGKKDLLAVKKNKSCN